MPGDRRSALRTMRDHDALLAAADPVELGAPTLDQLRAGILAEFTADLDRRLADVEDGGSLVTLWEFHPIRPDGRFAATSIDRNSPEGRAWRRAVLARDGHACTACDATDNLEAHHILEWATHPAQRFVLANGRTLCHDCHQGVHHG